MNKKRKLIGFCCLFLLFAYFLILAIDNITTKTPLTKTEITTRVESLYGGKVISIIPKDNTYAVSFETEGATYEVIVDEENGRFSELELIYENPNTALNNEESTADKKNNPTPPSIESPSQESPNESNEQKPVLLTERQVRTIAQKQVNGEVEDIDYFNTAEGGYYLVEIDGEDVEAVLQIHAVTGKILSVSFDD